MSPRLRCRPLQVHGGRYVSVKDPCPVRVAGGWHLFGTGILAADRFEILHATAPDLHGRWQLRAPVRLPDGLRGSCLAAPGAIAEDGEVQMFVQTDYNLPDGRIEYLRSRDGGESFEHLGTALESSSQLGEAGIYDAHPAVLGGERYLAYSAFSTVGEPDIHLARSAGGGWEGPWERLGPILRHEEVPFHNPRGAEDYEWGLEGAQLLELPDGGVLLIAVCFLDGGRPAFRQRVFTACAPRPEGPYEVLEPLLERAATLLPGENGHAAGLLDGAELSLMFQHRPSGDPHWRYALANVPLAELAPRQPAAAL